MSKRTTNSFPLHGSEESIQKRMTECRHWQGTLKPGIPLTPITRCRADVEFDKLRDDTLPPGLERMPCFNPDVPCEKASYPTRKEILAQIAEEDAFIERMGIIRAAILEDLGGKRSGAGTITCPCCKTGTVRYSRASLNGHVHATCSTPKCASWME